MPDVDAVVELEHPVARVDRALGARPIEDGPGIAEVSANGMRLVERLHRPAVGPREPVPGELACAAESSMRPPAANERNEPMSATSARVEVLREVVMAGTVGGASNRPATAAQQSANRL